MHQSLHNILNLIGQSEPLSPEQKQSVADWVKELDKTIDRTEKVKHTTAILLEETIAELEQKRRAVEMHKRELDIENALERVRARTMAMQKSEELTETSLLLFEQFRDLGATAEQTSIAIIHEEKETVEIFATLRGNRFESPYEVGISSQPAIRAVYDAYKSGKKSAVLHLRGDELRNYNVWRNSLRDTKLYSVDVRDEDHWYIHMAFFSRGLLSFSMPAPAPEEATELLQRFAETFNLTYTRFLDLQKAEAQTREAQIEAALERVRGRTMAMQRSDELSETSFVLFEQLKSLGEVAEQLSIGIYDEEAKVLTLYATIYGNQWMESGRIPFEKHSVHRKSYAAWKERKKSIVIDLSGQELDDFNRFKMETSTQYKSVEDLPKDRWVLHSAFFSKGSLTFSTHEPRPQATVELLERFAAVFDLTYTRFLDLKRAEAQAREAQIEAALEKVRGKAMAMHTSGDLGTTVSAAFSELRKLGLETIRTGVALYSNERPAPVFYASTTTEKNEALAIIGSPDPSSHHCLAMQYEAWSKQQNYFPVLNGAELETYYDVLSFQPFVHDNDDSPFQHDEYGYYLPFSEGNFYAWSLKPFGESDINILARFKAIIDLTFRRYFELQKAETQAREAKIETALEKVRARALAMQEPEELVDVARVLRQEMGALGVEELETSTIFIHDSGTDTAGCWFAIKETKQAEKRLVAGHITLDLNATWVGREMLAFFGSDQNQVSIAMKDVSRREWIEYCYRLSPVLDGFYGEQIPDRTYHLYKFNNGAIGTAASGDISDTNWGLLSRAASVFSLAYSRFRDLSQARIDLQRLKEEKKRAEDALTELRATQEQLLQQEKLASLGQLTAGIAHEIKNPLNFVNNFSSVSVDLVDEALQEINSATPSPGNGDVKNLLGDIRNNLTRIVEHGSRADKIVKSMLQHSRGGNSTKEPNDLNMLIRGFANLAFHGMRAGNEPINVSIDLDLDESISPIPLVAEDFSRVILNLCQNAFDAMRDKLASGEAGSYVPRLALSTRRGNGTIRVEIEDNGPGIPEPIKHKILQPFFTTKKGTQGTGLGLSIANDIVKAHGGELSIENNAHGGATFVIMLPEEIRG